MQKTVDQNPNSIKSLTLPKEASKNSMILHIDPNTPKSDKGVANCNQNPTKNFQESLEGGEPLPTQEASTSHVTPNTFTLATHTTPPSPIPIPTPPISVDTGNTPSPSPTLTSTQGIPTQNQSNQNQPLYLDHFPPLPASKANQNVETSQPKTTMPTSTMKATTTPTIPPMPKPQGYASLFKNNREPSHEHTLDQELEEDLFTLEENDLWTVEKAWGFSLIGFLVGYAPSPRLVRELMRGWGVQCKFSFHRNGWVLFEFETDEAMLMVKAKGSYVTSGKSWIIRAVPQYFAFADSCFSSVPIWVNLHSLPKQCWSRKVLSKIASQLGKPVCSDRITAEGTFHDCARILVEVDVTKEAKKVVSFRMPNGKIWDQPIEYEVAPVVCQKCHSLGHLEDHCRRDRPQQTRERSISRGARRAHGNTTTQQQPIDKGKKKVDGQPEMVGPRVRDEHRLPVLVIRESTDSGQQGDGDTMAKGLRPTEATPMTQMRGSTPQVKTPNQFAILADSVMGSEDFMAEGRSGSTRVDFQLEEEASPQMIQALLQEDDLLEEEDAEGEALQYQTETEAREDQAMRRMDNRGRRRRGAGAL